MMSSALGCSRPSSSAVASTGYNPAATASASPASSASSSSAMSVAQTADLWLKIDQLHLNYLKAEESQAKLDIRKKLEGYVHQYLCVVPHERKFVNPLTGDVIAESARWMPDFSAVRAAQAFAALETYASNVINQPWRVEFREIKKYGGFYKHNVDTCLNGADRLLHEMGYGPTPAESLVLDGPVDQDKATVVARDCILACVECQILVAAMQALQTTSGFTATWEELIAFRRDHVGTPEQAARSLAYEKSQRQYRSAVTSTPTAPLSYQQQPYSNHQQQLIPMQPQPYQPIPPVQNGTHTQIHHDQLQLQQQQQQQHLAYPPLSHPGYGAHLAPPVYPTSNGAVPTGQLIDAAAAAEKRSSFVSSASTNSTLTGDGGPIPLTVKNLEEEHRRKSGVAMINGSLDSWDYVYRQLENIGYTKDQAERPDVLALLNKVTMARQKTEELQQQQRNYHQPLTMSSPETTAALSPLSHAEVELLRHIREARITTPSDDIAPVPGRNSSQLQQVSHGPHGHTERGGGGHGRQQQQQQGRVLDGSAADVGDDEVDAVHRRLRSGGGNGERRGSAERLRKKADQNKKRSSRHSRHLSPPKVTAVPAAAAAAAPSTSSSSSSSARWECHACTYLNKARVDICEMCGKSRNSPLPPPATSANGVAGRAASNGFDDVLDGGGVGGDVIACQKCTLENDRRLKVCEACGASLHKKAIAAETAASSESGNEWRTAGKKKKHSGSAIRHLGKNDAENNNLDTLRKRSTICHYPAADSEVKIEDGGCKRLRRKNSRMVQ